ncbi:6137_t:CDS:2, partial [Gigaspora margarita]
REPGDGGIDYVGDFREYTILTQFKNYDEPGSIGPKYIRELEDIMSRYNKLTTIGVIIAPTKLSFSKKSVRRAKSSKYILILTDQPNLFSDLNRVIDSQSPFEF